MSQIPALDFDWIVPDLAMGGARAVTAAARLAQEHHIRHVVDVRVEDKDDEEALGRHGITLLHLPTEDMRAISNEMLDHGVSWVRERLERGDRVLVHCQHGVGRSALLVCCVLVGMGHGPAGALRLAKRSRPCISPSPEQLAALLGWSQAFQVRRGGRPFTESFRDLNRILVYPNAPR